MPWKRFYKQTPYEGKNLTSVDAAGKFVPAGTPLVKLLSYHPLAPNTNQEIKTPNLEALNRRNWRPVSG